MNKTHCLALFYVSGKTAKSKVVSVDPIRHVEGRGDIGTVHRKPF